MLVSLEQLPEPVRAGGEDDLVGLDLVLVTGKRHVQEILLLSQILERVTHIGFEIIPPEAEFVTMA